MINKLNKTKIASAIAAFIELMAVFLFCSVILLAAVILIIRLFI